MHGDPHAPFRNAKGLCYGGIRHRRFPDGKINFQFLELGNPAGVCAFITKPPDDPGKERDCPFLIKNPIRILPRRRRDLKLRLGIQPIDRKMHLLTSAFLTLGATPFICQKMLQRPKQKGTEPSPFRISGIE